MAYVKLEPEQQKGYAPVILSNSNEQQPPQHHHHHNHQGYIHHKKWGEIAEHYTCQFCGSAMITDTRYVSGSLTYLAAATVCAVGLWAGCCLVPFCVNAVKDVEHSCSSCGRVVGFYRHV
eukprot:TRINITY_DN78_c0_g1_i2.p1 TRINITY_DN78_c0_g1~~TRINITY_DN78_c0_g1_i2.p1  ORF type:complete len:120 (+),score=6.47 TRINITY_DN78_c0_g1_i2:50-409(+)